MLHRAIYATHRHTHTQFALKYLFYDHHKAGFGIPPILSQCIYYFLIRPLVTFIIITICMIMTLDGIKNVYHFITVSATSSTLRVHT